MASVRFEHVSKRFGKVEVVQDITLAIQDQEFMVLVGPSGCGKTTCLRMIAGLEEASEGLIWIGERVVNGLEAKDRDIAMVFQNYALYPHMTVYENMAFGLKLRKVDKREIAQRVEAAAELLGLGGLLKRKPKELSGGQRQRVALGRAIVRRPQVFLMDEPLSNLDAKLRVQMRAELARLHQRVATTFVYVTHDQTEAMTMGDRIAVLNGGRLQQVGTPRQVYEAPANKFVAGFIGSPAMNFFEGALVERQEGALWVRIGGGQGLRLPEGIADRVRGYEGRRVTVGIRPEQMEEGRLVREREGEEGVRGRLLRMKVEVVEHLGNEQIVYGVVGEQTVVARVGARAPVRVGEEVEVGVEVERMQLFDETDERSLTASWAPPSSSSVELSTAASESATESAAVVEGAQTTARKVEVEQTEQGS